MSPWPRIAAIQVAALLAAPALAQLPRTGVVWSTYLGGNADDAPANGGIAVAGNGDVLTWGWTGSSNFSTQGAFQSSYGGPTSGVVWGLGDGYLARIKADGSALVWSSYLGGTGLDGVVDLQADRSGTITVCGTTNSPNFPVTAGAFQATAAGGWDAFVARFTWDGQQLALLWSTRLGGSGDDSATSLEVHPNGNIYVAGHTTSTNLPMTVAPFQSMNAGRTDGFLAVVDSTGGQLLAATYLGGSRDDFSLRALSPIQAYATVYPLDLALDVAGNPVVGGAVASTDFPVTTNAFQPSFGGGPGDSAVVVLDPSLAHMLYGTYLGGSDWDNVWNLTLAPSGAIAVCGGTNSLNFPVTANCYDATFNGGSLCFNGNDAFVTLLDRHQPPSTQLSWSTYFGAAWCELATSVVVDPAGFVTLTGILFDQGNFGTVPTTPGSFQPTHGGGTGEMYVAQFDPGRSGSAQLLYATHLGGNGTEGRNSVTLDAHGNTVFAGWTRSTNFPITPGSYDPTFNGAYDLCITKLNLLPQDVVRYGASTPACLHPIYQSVDSWPTPGNAGFTLMAHGAPPNAVGLIAFGVPNPGGSPMSGIGTLLIGSPIITVFGTADARGSAQWPLPVPSTLSAGPPYGIGTQWFFLTSPGCPGVGPVAHSEGLSW